MKSVTNTHPDRSTKTTVSKHCMKKTNIRKDTRKVERRRRRRKEKKRKKKKKRRRRRRRSSRTS